MLQFILRTIDLVFLIYYILILASILLSWRRYADQTNTWVNWVYRLTDPYLNIFRRFLPPRPGSRFDWSPILAIFVLMILESLVQKIVLWLAVLF